MINHSVHEYFSATAFERLSLVRRFASLSSSFGRFFNTVKLISRGSVMATHLGRGDIFCDARNENLLLCMQMKKN